MDRATTQQPLLAPDDYARSKNNHDGILLASSVPIFLKPEEDDDDDNIHNHDTDNIDVSNNNINRMDNGGGGVSEFTKLISQVGNGITPWGREVNDYDHDFDNNNHYNEPLLGHRRTTATTTTSYVHHHHQQQQQRRRKFHVKAGTGGFNDFRFEFDQNDNNNSRTTGIETEYDDSNNNNNQLRQFHNNNNNRFRDVPIRICTRTNASSSSSSNHHNYNYSWITIIASSFCLFHITYVIGGSLLVSKPWIITTLEMSVEHVLKNNSGYDNNVPASLSGSLPVHSSTMATLLQDLDVSRVPFIRFIIFITALVLPCTFVILSPSWILYDYGIFQYNQHQPHHHNPSYQRIGTRGSTSSGSGGCDRTVYVARYYDIRQKPRYVFELCTRWCFLIGYVFIFLSIVMNHIRMNWTHTTVRTITTIQSGLFCYMIGIFYAICMLIVLRLPVAIMSSSSSSPRDQKKFYNGTSTNTNRNGIVESYDDGNHVRTSTTFDDVAVVHDEQGETSDHSDVINTSTRSVPPPHAFQFPWENSDVKKEDQLESTTTKITTIEGQQQQQQQLVDEKEGGDDMQENHHDTTLLLGSPTMSNNLIINDCTIMSQATDGNHNDDDELEITFFSDDEIVNMDPTATTTTTYNNQQHHHNNNEDGHDFIQLSDPYHHPCQSSDDDLVRSLPKVTVVQQFLMYQLLLVTTITLIPAYCLPLFEFKYYGIASNLLNQSDVIVFLYNLPQLIADGNYENQPVQFILVGMILILVTIILPLISLLLSITIWMCRGSNEYHKPFYHCRNWLYAIHPGCGGNFVFAIAFLMTLHILEPISTIDGSSSSSSDNIWLLNDHSKICAALTAATSESCLIVQGFVLYGGWFYFVQSILLEFVIYITLQCN